MRHDRQSDTLHFADASLCLSSTRLTRGSQEIALRPTTARLLAVLLMAAEAEPARVQSKDELIHAVWPGGQATQQSLFQAISELRRALAPLKPIVTVPNQGYRFALEVTRAGTGSWPRLSMVASVLLLLMVVIAGQGGPEVQEPAAASVSPSLSAFARGVALLQSDRPAEAEQLFRAVLLEAPSLAGARVLLGEAILAQGRLDDAREYAASLLTDADQLDPVSDVSALALMSRTQEQAGRTGEALHWALVAAERAQREALACAAADIDDRIAALMEGVSVAGQSPNLELRKSPWPEAPGMQAHPDPLSARDAAAEPADRPARCAMLLLPAPEARQGRPKRDAVRMVARHRRTDGAVQSMA